MKEFDRNLLPDLLMAEDGSRIDTAQKWEEIRRPEIIRFFQDKVFGRFPEHAYSISYRTEYSNENALDGRAICETVYVCINGPLGEFTYPFFMFIPKCSHPVAATLLISNRSKEENLDITRKIKSDFWPVEEIVNRGVAACAFYACDVDTDADDGFQNGVHTIFNEKHGRTDWATLASWAWGAMRIMDYLERDVRIDANHVAVVGQSRGGKTAILAGACDLRFAAVYSSCSGCMGAALSRFKDGEHVRDIVSAFPYWFCDEFRSYSDREKDMPFDQDALLATIAPRMIYVTSATMDDWADPDAELAAVCMTRPIYRLYGLDGLPEETMHIDKMHLLEKPLLTDKVGYHRRIGVHDLTTADWMRFLDFFLRRIEETHSRADIL